jgi:arylsulfatase A-like enzyme
MPPGTSGPNVLFLMTDQQHHQTLSASGNRLISTPHLDRIARQGARFELATCVTPYCSPARASIVTGLYPHRHGIVSNVAPFRDQHGLKEGMFPVTESLLFQQGYAAGHRGKWHLGDKGDFDCYQSLGYHGMQPREYAELLNERLPRRRSKPPAGEKAEATYLGRPVEMLPAVAEAHRAYMQWPNRSRQPISIIGRTDVPAELLPEGMITDQVIGLIRQHADRRFMVTASWSPPHALWVAPEPYYSLVDREKIRVPDNLDRAPDWMAEQTGKKLGTLMGPEGIREYIGVYHGQVKMIDDYVGRILDTLDELGLADNTLVIFTSDHGDMLGEHGVIGKSVGGFYEGILRIPMLMRLPGRIPEGAVVGEPVSQVDLMPTILDYVGLDCPGNLHGRSLRPLLEGRAEKWRDHSLCQRPDMRMIRTERFKYVFRANRRHELFDLADDPRENENRIADRASREVVGQMHGRLRAVMQETGDPMLATMPDDPPA